MAESKQFNVYLSRELIKQVKRAALEAEKSLSAWVEDVLSAAVDGGNQ